MVLSGLLPRACAVVLVASSVVVLPANADKAGAGGHHRHTQQHAHTAPAEDSASLAATSGTVMAAEMMQEGADPGFGVDAVDTGAAEEAAEVAAARVAVASRKNPAELPRPLPVEPPQAAAAPVVSAGLEEQRTKTVSTVAETKVAAAAPATPAAVDKGMEAEIVKALQYFEAKESHAPAAVTAVAAAPLSRPTMPGSAQAGLVEQGEGSSAARQAQVRAHGSLQEQEAAARGQVSIQRQALGLIRRERLLHEGESHSATREGNTQEVDVTADSAAANATSGAVVDTTSYRAGDPNTGIIDLWTNSWGPWTGVWTPVTYSIRNYLCFVTGLAKAGTWDLYGVAQLPSKCRPNKNLVFSVNNHGDVSRVDVTKAGMIEWKGGGRSHGWLSLSGIVFSANGLYSAPLTMQAGWQTYEAPNMPKEFGTPSFTLSNGICVLEGTITSTSASMSMARLPEECRPKKNLMFSVYQNKGGAINDLNAWALVKVQADGKVELQGAVGHWLSLSGISFATRALSSSLVAITEAWQPYTTSTPGEDGLVTFSASKGACVVEGWAKPVSAWSDEVGELPQSCRPEKRLVFQVGNPARPARVDITPDGKIAWQGGGNNLEWLSLSGIAFDVKLNAGPTSVLQQEVQRGENGKDGMNGTQGEQGERGPPGRDGPIGVDGDMGPIGPPGPIGPEGEPGKDGMAGLTGEKGEPGNHGRDGSPGPIGMSGLNGQPGAPGRNGFTPPKVPCEWAPWMAWMPCTRTCGGGVMVRFRNVKVHPQNGGEDCTSSFIDQSACHVQACVTNATANGNIATEEAGTALLEQGQSDVRAPKKAGAPRFALSFAVAALSAFAVLRA